MEQVEIPKDIVKLAEDLISSGEVGYETIKLYALETEEEQHDDEVIDSVIQAFSQLLEELAIKLEKVYGTPKLTLDGGNEDEIEEDNEEAFYVPCSFSSAVWETEDYILYLGVCQEDRELPICLVIGVEF